MGHAWEAFQKAMADESANVDVHISIPGWAWVLLGVVIFILVVVVSVMVGYQRGMRGCELATHALSACLAAAMGLMRRRNDDDGRRGRPHQPLDHTRSAVETTV